MHNITHPTLEHKVEKLPAYILGKTPADFDPKRFPIIARHVFGIEPPSFGAACVTIAAVPDITLSLNGGRQSPPVPIHQVGGQP